MGDWATGRLSSSSSSGKLGSLEDSSDALLTNILEDWDSHPLPRTPPPREEILGNGSPKPPPRLSSGDITEEMGLEKASDSLGEWVGVNATNPFEDGGDTGSAADGRDVAS